MKLKEILESIKQNHSDITIHFLADKMAAGDLSCRKQLADKVCVQSTQQNLPAGQIMEICRWGINDDLSQIPEIKALKNTR